MRLAIGTSLVIITASSAIGLITHLDRGAHPDAGITLAMAAACGFPGPGRASALSGKVPERVLGRAFATMVIAVAAYLIVFK